MVKGEPLRRCVACRRSRPKRELVRVVRGRDGMARLDVDGTSPGRGAYVCREADCARRALERGALGRALRARLPEDEAARLERPGVHGGSSAARGASG